MAAQMSMEKNFEENSVLIYSNFVYIIYTLITQERTNQRFLHIRFPIEVSPCFSANRASFAQPRQKPRNDVADLSAVEIGRPQTTLVSPSLVCSSEPKCKRLVHGPTEEQRCQTVAAQKPGGGSTTKVDRHHVFAPRPTVTARSAVHLCALQTFTNSGLEEELPIRFISIPEV